MAIGKNPPILNFFGLKYNTYVLEKDAIVFRVGNHEKELGGYFSFDKPKSEIQARVDKALPPQWTSADFSKKVIVETGYKVKIPKGTTIHVGLVGPQVKNFLGGGNQIFIHEPWNIQGVKVLEKFDINQEISWNHMPLKK